MSNTAYHPVSQQRYANLREAWNADAKSQKRKTYLPSCGTDMYVSQSTRNCPTCTAPRATTLFVRNSIVCGPVRFSVIGNCCSLLITHANYFTIKDRSRKKKYSLIARCFAITEMNCTRIKAAHIRHNLWKMRISMTSGGTCRQRKDEKFWKICKRGNYLHSYTHRMSL